MGNSTISPYHSASFLWLLAVTPSCLNSSARALLVQEDLEVSDKSEAEQQRKRRKV